MVNVLDDFHGSDGHSLGELAGFVGARVGSSLTAGRAVFAAVLVVFIANMHLKKYINRLKIYLNPGIQFTPKKTSGLVTERLAILKSDILVRIS